MQRTLVAVALFASMTLAGCGRDTPETTQPQDATTAAPPVDAAPPAPAAAPASNPTATIAVDDIDRWVRGMQAELQAVQASGAKLSEAKDDNAKLEALTASTEMKTVEAGASAAGVDVDRYRRIRNVVSEAIAQLSPLEMEMDVSKMPTEMIDQFKQARASSAAQLEKDLPADVFAALKTRAGELREQEKLLVAERLKIASNAR